MHNDGHIEILFNFMPPLNGKLDREDVDDENEDDEEYWDSFEEVLSKHLGVEVLRDDRELFIIEEPQKDTAQKLKQYLENYWK